MTWYAFSAIKKRTYRIRNWSEYNASLKQRGSGAIWISPEAIKNWTTDELTGEPGASPTYTDLAIETVEAREQLSSPEFGGDSGLSLQDGLWRSVANSPD